MCGASRSWQNCMYGEYGGLVELNKTLKTSTDSVDSWCTNLSSSSNFKCADAYVIPPFVQAFYQKHIVNQLICRPHGSLLMVLAQSFHGTDRIEIYLVSAGRELSDFVSESYLARQNVAKPNIRAAISDYWIGLRVNVLVNVFQDSCSVGPNLAFSVIGLYAE